MARPRIRGRRNRTPDMKTPPAGGAFELGPDRGENQ